MTSPSRSVPRSLPLRGLALALMVAAIGLSGCGGGGGDDLFGSAGVSNGGLVGSVQGLASIGTIPISGAFITATRLTTPVVSRTTRSDANGDYAFTDLPLGPYRVTVSASGFVQDAGVVEVFIESGNISLAPPIFLTGSTSLGASNLVVTLLDETTGEPIEDATVFAGTASAAFGAGGVYGLAVPVSASTGSSTVTLGVSAEGYDGTTVLPRTITLFAGEVVSVTVTVRPHAGNVTGQIRIAGSEGFHLANGSLSTVEIFVSNVSTSFSQSLIDPGTGQFSVLVPASSSRSSRTFTLTFSSPLFELAVISGVIAPTAGSSRSLTGVTLTPINVTLSGQVLTSSGGLAGQGGVATVTVLEIGTTTNIVNGGFALPGIPVGIPLTLDFVAFNPTFGVLETARSTVLPVSTQDGTFFVPTVTTRP